MGCTMRRLTHIALTILAALAIVTAGAASARAADPSAAPNTLGARVQSIVVVAESPDLTVTNLGSVPETFSFAAPDGWTVAPTTIALDPGTTGKVTLTGQGDPGKVIVTATSTGAVTSGTDRSAIQFAATVMATRPFDPWRYIPTIGTALLLLAGAGFLTYRIKPWNLRLTRAA